MRRNRQIKASELVASTTQLSFTVEIERERERGKLFMLILKDHVINLKHIKIQLRLGDVNDDVKVKTLAYITKTQEWLTELMTAINQEYKIFKEGNAKFEYLHKEREGLNTYEPYSASTIAEMLERALSRFRGFVGGFSDFTEPLFADYVKGSINQLKRAYLVIK